MSISFTDSFDREFQKSSMMGPNALRISEELASYLPIKKGARILDLGCGMGLSSILLSEKYGAALFAADLWIDPTDNFKRFQSLNIDDKIVPILLDVTKGIPFPHGYFDIIFSVDSYHYFGANSEMLPSLVPYIKTGGYIAVAVPGFKDELYNEKLPSELKPFWQENMNFHSTSWWRNLWSNEKRVRIESCREMDCLKKSWEEWLSTSNPYAIDDIEMMRAEDGKYFNLVQLIAKIV